MIGHWTDTPLGEFSDAMVETAAGHRVLLAPHWEAREFIEATYSFDEVRIEPFKVDVAGDTWRVHSTSLELELTLGRRTGLGLLLKAVPRRVAEAPAWCAVTDPIARVTLRGVRTRGTANRERREWYGATDSHRVTAMTGRFDGADLGGADPRRPAHPLRLLLDPAPAVGDRRRDHRRPRGLTAVGARRPGGGGEPATSGRRIRAWQVAYAPHRAARRGEPQPPASDSGLRGRLRRPARPWTAVSQQPPGA